MDVEYGHGSLTYRAIGGILDFYFFAGPSPLAVVDQYTALVGRPVMPPYWTLGFHQSRYGYRDLEELAGVVAHYKDARIPLEAIWSDIDSMHDWKDFTLDPVNFPEAGMREFVDKLHQEEQHFIVIIDPVTMKLGLAGIKVEKGYPAYERGLAEGVFILDRQGAPYLGQVWPGPVHYPDFLHPATEGYWAREIVEFHGRLPFDALWIDTNEPSNFCTAIAASLPEDRPCPVSQADVLTCCLVINDTDPSLWDRPPYDINAGGGKLHLNYRTVAMSATHYNGVLEYNAHNLYGLAEAKATSAAMWRILGRRPFVLSRSTFPGAGRFAGHWTGDNAATWEDLYYSIPAILDMGLFGIPFVGADICGFAGNTTEELCSRWAQLGAFYPFSRNHGAIESSHQELYLWESVAEVARNALALRYRLLPYLYTLSYEAHVSGHPMARSLWMHHSQDPQTIGIDKQFLLGSGLLVTPVLTKGTVTVEGYFPNVTWYSLVERSHICSTGEHVQLEAPLDTIHVHVAAGSIIPMQQSAMTTEASRRTPFELIVAFQMDVDADVQAGCAQLGISSQEVIHKAHGQLYWDKGVERDLDLGKDSFTLIQYNATISISCDPTSSHLSQMRGRLEARVDNGGVIGDYSIALEAVAILGVPKRPSSVFLVDGPKASELEILHYEWPRLHIAGLTLPMEAGFVIEWEHVAQSNLV
eukprot:SM000002S05593  [mRNA]  locus=s2:1149104:1151597:+ [translate_table: standard]